MVINTAKFKQHVHTLVLVVVIALIAQSVPTIPFFGELRKYTPHLILLFYVVVLNTKTFYSYLDGVVIITAIFGVLYLLIQNVLLRVELAYFSNLIIFVFGLILANNYDVQQSLGRAVLFNGLLQILIELHYYAIPAQMSIKLLGFTQELDGISLLRFTGSLGDPNYFGAFLFLCLILCYQGFLKKLLLFLAGILSLSKGAALAFLAWTFRTSRFNVLNIIIFLISCLFLFTFIVSQRDGFSGDSNNERLEAILSAFKLSILDPQLMLGDSIVSPIGRPMVVHNFYIQSFYTNIFLFISLTILSLMRLRSPIFIYFLITAMLLDFSSSPLFLFLMPCLKRWNDNT